MHWAVHYTPPCVIAEQCSENINWGLTWRPKESTRSILPVKKGMRTCELTPSTVSFSLPTCEYIANKNRRAQLLVVNVFHGTMHEWNAHATFVSTAKE